MKKEERNRLLKVKDLGLIDHSLAYGIQQQTLRDIREGDVNTLLCCEHPNVFTLGRLANENNILLPKENIEQEGIKILRIDRGGEITFHGPGQLVVYPIFRLEDFGKDLKSYLRRLEQAAIDLLTHFDIVARRIEGQRGIWAGNKKIASIGIGVRKWISFHGMAVNVNCDLRFFAMIKPCGLDVQMTSMREMKGKEIPLAAVKETIVQCFCRNFGLQLATESAYAAG